MTSCSIIAPLRCSRFRPSAAERTVPEELWVLLDRLAYVEGLLAEWMGGCGWRRESCFLRAFVSTLGFFFFFPLRRKSP